MLKKQKKHNGNKDTEISDSIQGNTFKSKKLNIKQFKLTDKQKKFLHLTTLENTKIIFMDGVAGSAKTFNAVLASLQLYNINNNYEIKYVRTIIESADRNIGSLPGMIADKTYPFLIPLEEKLEELLPPDERKELMKNGIITSIPINFVRGSNWKDKIVIVDECISGKHTVICEDRNYNIKTLLKMYESGEVLPKVLSFNTNNNTYEYKKILNVIHKGKKDVIKITASNKELITTPDHLFYTTKGWIEARNLTHHTPIISSLSQRHQVLDVLNDDQLQIFMGSYLGDGGIQKCGGNQYRLKIIHSIKQKDYLGWKAFMFNRENCIKYIEKNGFSQKPAVVFGTKCFSLPFEINESKKTSCPQYILDNLDVRGLSIWCMDDGSLSKYKNGFTLHTESFDYETQERFVDFFKKINIKCSIRTSYRKLRDKTYFYLNFNKEDTEKLCSLISPYVHKNLEYKILNITKKYLWNNDFLKFNVVVPKKVEPYGQDDVYDIEVEDNHNFFIANNQGDGLLVHNCQNFSTKELITALTRIGENTKVFICGDSMQSDINGKSGFVKIMNLFDNEESRSRGIYCVKFTEEDIMRSEILKYLITKFKTLNC